MREIKFRAWDKRQRQMSGAFTITDLTQYEYIFEVKFKHLARFKDLIWLEYTGLKDKNGKEIYEGDIVSEFRKDFHRSKIESRYPVCFGVYDNGEEYKDSVVGNGWYLGQELFFRAGKREAGNWESKCEHLINADSLEVIGNIWENKELLEKKGIPESILEADKMLRGGK